MGDGNRFDICDLQSSSGSRQTIDLRRHYRNRNSWCRFRRCVWLLCDGSVGGIVNRCHLHFAMARGTDLLCAGARCRENRAHQVDESRPAVAERYSRRVTNFAACRGCGILRTNWRRCASGALFTCLELFSSKRHIRIPCAKFLRWFDHPDRWRRILTSTHTVVHVLPAGCWFCDWARNRNVSLCASATCNAVASLSTARGIATRSWSDRLGTTSYRGHCGCGSRSHHCAWHQAARIGASWSSNCGRGSYWFSPWAGVRFG